jgi:hypothetical protein
MWLCFERKYGFLQSVLCIYIRYERSEASGLACLFWYWCHQLITTNPSTSTATESTLLILPPGSHSQHLCFLSVDTSLKHSVWDSHHGAWYLASPYFAWTLSFSGSSVGDTVEYLDHKNLSCCFSLHPALLYATKLVTDPCSCIWNSTFP